jgi:phage/plasmid-associated DNA primase
MAASVGSGVNDNTIGSVIAELKAALMADIKDPDVADKTRALHLEMYQEALAQLQTIDPVLFKMVCKEIAKILDVAPGDIQRSVNLFKASNMNEDEDEEEPNKVSEAVDRWIAQYHFVCRTDGDILYYYKDGVYVPKGELLLSEMAEKEFKGVCSNNMVKEIIGMAKRRTYVDPEKFNVNPAIINVKNGLLNIWTKELKPHTHELYYTVQLPVKYNPTATCPRIEGYFKEIVAPEDVPLLEEVVGWNLWRPYDIHKAIMLHGMGRNGKGAFIRLNEAFLGIENVSHVSLPTLVSERFAGIDLVGKAGNFYGDLPAKDLSETDVSRLQLVRTP